MSWKFSTGRSASDQPAAIATRTSGSASGRRLGDVRVGRAIGTVFTLRLTGTLVLITLAALLGTPGARAAGYKRPPSGREQWYWEIDPATPGLAGLPSTTGRYPAPGSADIWDTDLFQDSNTARAGIPTGGSPVVRALHASRKYSICYIEAGAYQTTFPDDSDFVAADYGAGARRYRMKGYPNEWWLNIAGFRHYVAGDRSTLTGAAVNIAAALNRRIGWCAREGQDAIEPDDLDGYLNQYRGDGRRLASLPG